MPAHRRPTFRHGSEAGFSLLELLIVLGIIVVLVGLLVPSASRARENARATTCSSNQRQLMQAFLAFAADHENRLPGNWFDGGNADPDLRAWLINPGQPISSAPQVGTIWKYVKNEDLYRCPSLQLTYTNAGAGSNGRFDYAAFIMFAGARVSDIPRSSQFSYGGVVSDQPTPIICEEEPMGGINGGNVEGGHCNTDSIAHTHRGGGYYASIDGSVHWFLEPLKPTKATCWNWSTRGPSGTMRQLGSGATFGSWSRQ